MKALVVGADGFVGRHLVAHLRDEGDEVVEVVGRREGGRDAKRSIDVTDAAAVRRLVAEVRAEAIYHLAAVAYGPDASRDLGTAVAVTVAGTANVLGAAAEQEPRPTVLLTGSSEVYGNPAVDPISEATPVAPVSPYGATKLAQEAIGLTYGRAVGLLVVATRSFNHIGPGQRDAFAVASFARQLRDIADGSREPVLRVGNLEPVRDFTDVRDVVRAYRLLVAGGHVGEPINVASGRGVAIRDVVDELIKASGVRVEVQVDPKRVRTTDPARIVGDASRLHRLTGWKPAIPLSRTLADIWASLQPAR